MTKPNRASVPLTWTSVLLGVSIALLLPGCAARAAPRTELDPEQWRAALQERGVDPDVIAYPLESDDALVLAARRYAGGTGSPTERLKRLQSALFDADVFPFEYIGRATYPAREVFARRAGNCVSFTNLFIAMGRSLGLPVRPALLLHVSELEREGDLVVVNTHMVAMLRGPRGVTVFDFAQSREGPPVGIRILDDLWLTAIFLNNLGVEDLREGKLEEARARFEQAVSLAGEFVAAYGNLGVVYRRLGQPEKAFDAYLMALRLEPRNASVLTNLAALYRAQAMEREARDVLRTISARDANAHTLMLQADQLMAEGAASNALQLYQRASRLDRGSAEPLVASARAELYLGRPRLALRALRRALSVEPEHPEARHLLSLLEKPPQFPESTKEYRLLP
jgi:Flp pilus assembly protein TadD